MKSDDVKAQLTLEYLSAKIRLFLLSFRWASLLLALFLLFAQKPIPWWIIIIAIAYNISVIIYLKFYSNNHYGHLFFLLLDLVVCISLFVISGYMANGIAINPFFLYSFTPLLGITIKYRLKGGLLAATLLALSYLTTLLDSSNVSSMATEFADTHIANILSFYFIAIIVAQVASSLAHHDLYSTVSSNQGDTKVVGTYIDTLSTREIEVLHLLCEGKIVKRSLSISLLAKTP